MGMLLGAMAARPVWLDGALVSSERAQTSVLSHAIQRGSLVFDVGALREARQGVSLLFRPREHIERLRRSAALVGLDVPWDDATLLAATVETARASGATSGLVRWSAFVATLEADVVARPEAHVTVAIAVITPADYATGGEVVPRPSASRVTIPRDVRKAGPEVFSPQAKVAAAYLGPMLAKRRAIERGFDDVVLLDGDGRVAEAPTANVFIVKNGVLLTPPIDRVLAGITRDTVLAIARADGIDAREAHLTAEELADADEAFLAGTSLPLQPIASVDHRPMRGGAPGPITDRMRRAVVRCERGEDPRCVDWTVAVR